MGEIARMYMAFLTCFETNLCDPERCITDEFQVDDWFGLRCYCGPSCVDKGTCCVNYEDACLRNSSSKHFISSTLSYFEEDFMNSAGSLAKCEYMENGYSTHWLVVSRCRRPLLTTVKDVELCEGDWRELSQVIPVVTANNIYANIHCARCNGHASNESLVDIVTTSLACSDEFLQGNAQRLEELAEVEILEAILSGDCKRVYNHAYFPDGSVCSLYEISECDPAYKDALTDYEQIEKACLSYANYLLLDDPTTLWLIKNVHCVVCNGVHWGMLCPPAQFYTPMDFPGRGPSFSFSILMDFSGTISARSEILGQCDFATEVLEVENNSCLQRDCAKGCMKVNESYCFSDTGVVKAPPIQIYSNETGARFPLYICLYFNSTPIIEELIFFNVFELPYEYDCLYTDYQRTTEITCEHVLGLTVLALKGLVVNYPKAVVTLASTKFRDYLVWKNNIHHAVFYPGPAIENFLEDIHQVGAEFILDESHKKSLMEAPEVFADHMKLYLPEFDLVTSLQNAQLKIAIEENSGVWKRTITAFISLSSASTKNTVCGQLNASDPQTSDNLTQTVESLLAIICSSLSIVALLACLVTHLLFPSLLNVPSKMLVNLALALMSAHVIFLLSGYWINDAKLCAVIGGVQHFFWLASFAWMVGLSAHLQTTMRHIGQPGQEGLTSFIPTFICAWGIPLVIVGICGVAHFTGHFTYGGAESCWIADPFHLGLAFGLPIGLSVATNIVLFILTAYSLRKAMNDAGRATPKYNIKYRLVVYTKLSLLMGGTWILGFLSNAPHLGFLKYAFTVLASLNGFFIAVSFTLSARFFSAIRTSISCRRSRFGDGVASTSAE